MAAGLGLACLRPNESRAADDEPATPLVRIGLVTDLHYADKPPGGSRHYRDSLAKLAAAGEQFAKAKTDVVVELGDFIDSADTSGSGKGVPATGPDRVCESCRAAPLCAGKPLRLGVDQA